MNNRDAIERSGVAEAAASSSTFAEAGNMIAAVDGKYAATAFTNILRAHRLYPGAEDAVKAAQRAVRDMLVVRLRAQARPGDRKAFLEAAAEAFGYTLDHEAKNLLLLSYSKIFKQEPDSFLSNTALATADEDARGRGETARAGALSLCHHTRDVCPHGCRFQKGRRGSVGSASHRLFRREW